MHWHEPAQVHWCVARPKIKGLTLEMLLLKREELLGSVLGTLIFTTHVKPNLTYTTGRQLQPYDQEFLSLQKQIRSNVQHVDTHPRAN